MRKLIGSASKRCFSVAGVVKNSLIPVLPNAYALDWDASKNWGDKLNVFLLRNFMGKVAFNPRFSIFTKQNNRLMMIGSILQRADEDCVVWGTGFMRSSEEPTSSPKQICAVRGPLSRAALLRSGIDCPEVYGDPAILLPKILRGSQTKKYRYGIVPHYADKNNKWVLEQKKKYGDQCLVIDVESAGIKKFVREISSCEIVFSSSLHGLICADAYGVKNVRLVLSDFVGGGDFKFVDYRKGVMGAPHVPVQVHDSGVNLSKLAHFASLAELGDTADKLWKAGPFYESVSH